MVLTEGDVLEGVEVVEGVGASGGLREEVERLRRDLAEAREQQAATSGVLAVLCLLYTSDAADEL